MKNITAVCPGSFDPITMGHLDIIRRASNMFEKVIILVMPNLAKTPLFSVEERLDMIKEATVDIENVEVDYYDGLLAEYAKSINAFAVVKGLRAVSDFEYEFQMALINKKLNPLVDTVFLTTSVENLYLSSSLVRQIGKLGGDISEFVPSCIHSKIKERLSGKVE